MTSSLPSTVRVYRVGGSVRDELLNLPPGDADWVVVGATPELMLASGFTPVGKDFPVFLHPDTHDEYALARTERKHGRGYRGFEFFATPDVTLDDDLRRRDLTINAMARAPDGALIDLHGGQADLRAGILRHVSPAFVEDPLRVLRVARFAARFGFVIATETVALMRKLIDAGELSTLAPERLWQELSRGLSEAHPSQMLRALRVCGALAALLPEVDALYASTLDGSDNAGQLTERALDWTAAHGCALPVRYAVLVQDLGLPAGGSARGRRPGVAAGMARANAVSLRLKAPADARDAARLAARWGALVGHADALPPSRLLDVINAADALRRPERLDWLIDAGCARVAAHGSEGCAAPLLRAALAAVRSVDASAIARAAALQPVADRTVERKTGDAIVVALRRARLAALRRFRRQQAGDTPAVAPVNRR